MKDRKMDIKKPTHSRAENIWRGISTGAPNIYTTVSDEVADEMGIPKNAKTRGHNDGRDGFRHAYISALVTYRYGYGVAKNMGDLNEAKNNLPWKEGNPPHEEWMDQHNNRVGRDIALDVQLKGGNEQDLKKAVKQAYEDGKLIDSPYDPRRTFREHGDWQRAIQEAEEILAHDKQRALDYLRKEGKLTPESQQSIEERYEEYRKPIEIAKKKNLPKPGASQPSDIRTGPNRDPAPTTVTGGSGGGEVFVHSYSRRTGDVQSHTRSSPDGNTGNNFGARGRSSKTSSSAGMCEPGPNEKRIPGAMYLKK